MYHYFLCVNKDINIIIIFLCILLSYASNQSTRCITVHDPIIQEIKVEYHTNAEYENPLKNSEKNSMCCSNVNVSNNGKKNTLPR